MSVWLFDSHVHCYRNYDLSILLQSAWRNAHLAYRRLTNGLKATEIVYPVLGLALTESEISWQELEGLAQQQRPVAGEGGCWRLSAMAERELLQAEGEGGAIVYLLAGRQLVSRENLELLVFGSVEPVADSSQSLHWHLQQNSRLLNILPWGVGKWLGDRGRIVSALIPTVSADSGVSFLLGDNSGRPGLWAWVPQFAQARQQSVPVWPGTDPLPLAGAEQLVATNGVQLDISNVEALSVQSIVEHGRNPQIAVVRQGVGLMAFIKSQLAIRRSR